MVQRRSALEFEKGPDGLELRLPRRFGNSSGALSVFVVTLALFGALFVFAGSRTLMEGSDDPQSAGGTALLVGLGMLIVSWLLFCSRTTIRIARDKIVISEVIGWLVRRQAIAREGLRGLRVQEAVGRGHGNSNRVLTACIQIRLPDGETANICRWYLKGLLRDVAERLAGEIGYVSDGERADERDYVPEGVDVVDDDFDNLPEGSRATVVSTDDGLLMTVPPMGLLRQHHALIGFGVIFALAGSIFSVILMVKMKEGDPRWAILLPATFIAVGAGLIVWSLALSRRRSVFEIADGELIVRRIGGFFGSKVQRWKADKVQGVEVVDGWVAVQGYELKVLSIKVAYVGRHMLMGRDVVELQWIAAKLREGLGLPEVDENGDKLTGHVDDQ